MPNLIAQLQREIHRVEQLYATLTGEELEKAKRMVSYAQQGLALNATNRMRESIRDLQDLVEKPKP